MFRLFAAISLIFLGVSAAKADCGPFPTSRYMASFSHDQVVGFVDKQYGGDWTPYLTALDANLERLNALLKAGKGTSLKVKGETVQLSDSELARFVYVTEQWLDVARCVAEEQTIQALNNFSTAAGGSGDGMTNVAAFSIDGSSNQEVARVNDAALDLRISTECQSGATIFKVQNVGGDWPDTARFSMFRLDGPNRQIISARRMRLGAGDIKTFTVSRKQNQTGHVGFAVEPTWYERPFEMDADARCE